MRDRVPTYPGRVTLTPVAGQTNTYDMVRADAPVEAGTPLNKANLMPDTLATTLGLNPDTATVAEGIGAAYTLGVNALPWNLIQKYTTAGTYTFVAPDLFGGQDYDIGALIIGGGGSGSAAKVCATADTYVALSGGASGYTQLLTVRVTPEQSYPVVIGAGGAATQTTGTSVNSVQGNSGASSSFGGQVAFGGGGGKSVTSTTATSACVAGADGAQGSDAKDRADTSTIAPANGSTTTTKYTSSLGLCLGGSVSPAMCFNPFAMDYILGAGGGASGKGGSSPTAYAQSAPQLSDGLSAGAGAARATSGDIIANSATSPGSGGGSALMTSATTNTSWKATSGAGAGGAVLIYARKAAE